MRHPENPKTCHALDDMLRGKRRKNSKNDAFSTFSKIVLSCHLLALYRHIIIFYDVFFKNIGVIECIRKKALYIPTIFPLTYICAND